MKKNMKKYITLFLVMGGFLLSSCEDFLQREPLDFGNENIFLKSTKDMAYFANKFNLSKLDCLIK